MVEMWTFILTNFSRYLNLKSFMNGIAHVIKLKVVCEFHKQMTAKSINYCNLFKFLHEKFFMTFKKMYIAKYKTTSV